MSWAQYFIVVGRERKDKLDTIVMKIFKYLVQN